MEVENEFDHKYPPPLSSKTEKNNASVSVDVPVKRIQSKKRFQFLHWFMGTFFKRLMISREDPESYVGATITELVIYVIYLVNLCIVTYGSSSANTFYFTKTIGDLFLDQKFNGSDTNFRFSTTEEHFWKFTETTMLKGLYWEYWYESPQNKILTDDQGIFLENRLLGVPRLRQIRVKQNSCPSAKKFRKIVRNCYPVYSEEEEEKGVWEESLAHLTAWKWHSTEELKGSRMWKSKLGYSYSGAGAYLLLGSTKAETMKKVEQIKRIGWITGATRVIFLDFTVYNANMNGFCVVRLVWEFPATGGMITSWKIRDVNLLCCTTTIDYVILVCEFILCTFVIYYFAQAIVQIIEIGVYKYLKLIWSYLDMLLFTCLFICLTFRIYRYTLMDNNLKDMMKESNQFIDFYHMGQSEEIYNQAVALCLFFSWIHVLKFISFNRTMIQFTNTSSRCAKDIGWFTVMFSFVFLAFVQVGFLLFGTQVESFSSFSTSLFTLVRLILGDFNYRDIESANILLGPIFFLSYVFFVFFVLLNMFLAIINDAYIDSKAEVQAGRQEIDVIDFIKRRFNSLMGLFGKRNKQLDIEFDIKLAATDEKILYNELRNNLLSSKFSNEEIEIFLARYDLDQECNLDEDEIQKILTSLEVDIKCKTSDNPHCQKILDEDSFDSQNKDMIETEKGISDMQYRVGLMESDLTKMTYKTDDLIRRLEAFQHTLAE